MGDDRNKDLGERQAYTVLRHPSGSTVYIVGTAHVSSQAAQDVVALINRVSPAVVVLELDEERGRKLLEQAEQGDVYGITKLRDKSTWEIVHMSMTGEALQFFMSAMYTITGALMGATPGGEFLAAIEAARGVGAQVMFADRDQNVTMHRLRYYTRHLSHHDSRTQAEMRRLRRMMDTPVGGAPADRPAIDQPTSMDVGRPPDFLSREPPPTRQEVAVEQEVKGTPNLDDPWGLSPDDKTESGAQRRMLELMRAGGCAQPNTVLAAAKRILQEGMDPKGTIRPADVLTVRECGNRMIETFRQQALRGDSTWLRRVEEEELAGARGVFGLELSNQAMRKVIVDERDVILARRLWEAGLEAGTQPVVGVVGAGHIKGITRYWDQAGEPDTEQLVQRYLQAPEEDRGAPWLTAAAGAAVLGTIAYRRPRAAALFAGAVALTAAPYLGFMLVTVNRFRGFADKLVQTAEKLEGGFSDEALVTDGWAAEGGSSNGADEWK